MPVQLKNETPKDMTIRVEQNALLERGLLYVDQYVNRQYMMGLSMYQANPVTASAFTGMRLLKIDKLVYDSDEELTDKLISLYGALNSISATAMLVLKSGKNGVELYLGTFCEGQASTAGGILQSGLTGNFGGTHLESLTESGIQKLFGEYVSGNRRQCVSTVTLVPSLRDEEKQRSVQGIEKLMDGMAGKEFIAVILAEPMPQRDIEQQKRGLEELYSTISPYAETSLAYGKNASYAVAEGSFSSFSKSLNNSISNSNGGSSSHSSSYGGGSGSSYSYNGFGSNSSSSYSESYISGSSWSQAVTSGETKTTSGGNNQTITNTIGENRTLTIKHTNKAISELLKNIDAQLERLHACESFGLWSTAAYFVSDDVQTTVMAASTFRALIAGDETYMDKSIINTWNHANAYTEDIIKSIFHGHHPRIHIPRMNEFDAQQVKPAVLVSGKELPIFMSFPRKSLPGLLVDYMATFGRSVYNPYSDPSHEHFTLGCVSHKGIPNKDLPVELDVEELRAHCFVTGSTGSGKSNTTYHMLNQLIALDKRFLVIEPAKGEYKFAFGGLENVNIFWTNPKQFKLLKLNPFSFPENIHVLEHMDRLIEILSLCWPLYSAMPAILKAAIERAYISCGWDLTNSLRIDVGKKVFPTFADLLRELPQVINESSYSSDAKGDYTGALVTRVSSLTNGIMGSIFCGEGELEDEVLFDQNTIVDLSRVGSSETKALMMGVLVMKLNEYRMSCGAGMNARLKHVTVLEEAHNLLRRPGSGSSELAAKSVEMISNSIAEMRSYGEGFIIVDQSPTSVDISAIKNTNTKIVMRLPEQADFEAVGSSFGLNPDQIREISRLPRGTAIVSQSGWLEPVLTAVSRASSRYETTLQAEEKASGVALKNFIDGALLQAENQSFSEFAMKRILRTSGISPNRRDVLMSLYRTMSERCQEAGTLSLKDKSDFVIRAIGCEALAEIHRLRIDPGTESKSWDTYRKWKGRIAKSLECYGDFGTEEEKMEIAQMLFIYMSQCVADSMYVRCKQVLNQNR